MHLSLSPSCHLSHIHIRYAEAVVRKWFSNFLGKHLGWSLFLIKLQAWKSRTLLKRDFNTSVFLWNLRNFTENLRWLLLFLLPFVNVSSFTSPLPHSHSFLTVLLLSSFEETLLSLYHYYYIINIIIAEIITECYQGCCNRNDLLYCHFHDSYTYYCFDGVYAETKKNNPWIKMTEKYSFIQACNFVNLPRIYDFAKFNSISSLTK